MIPWIKPLRWLRQWWLQAEGSWWCHRWFPNWGDYHPWVQTGTQALPLPGVTALEWQGSPDDPYPNTEMILQKLPSAGPSQSVRLLIPEPTQVLPTGRVDASFLSKLPFLCSQQKSSDGNQDKWYCLSDVFLSLLHDSEHIPIIPQGSVGLEKTLESPLDCKEIKPVNSKGNQH